MKPLCIPVLAVCASALSLPVCADDEPARSAEEIIVTASRVAEPLRESLAPVTVLTRADIERLQALDVQDLLVGLPGINLASNGGPGKSSSLFLRGTESDHVLVLIDGIKVGSATSGGTPFEQLPVDQIERIEIVRGPRSSLYGSEAIGGVIQIFTRRGTVRGATPSFAGGRGTRGDSRLEAGLRGGSGPFWFGFGVSGRSTDGVNVRPSVNEPDKDGFENRSGTARAGYIFGERAELSASYFEGRGKNDFDGRTQNQTESENQVLGASLKLRPLERWSLDLSAGRSRDESDNLLNGRFASAFNTQREHYTLINTLAFTDTQSLSLGADYQDDTVDSSTVYAERARDNTGAFAQYRGEFGAHEVQASLRSDDNQQFDRHQTGGVAYGFRFGSGLRAMASWGTAFKAPTFNELYFPGFGNAALDPEQARNVELGLSGLHGRYSWSVNAFRTEVDDLIAFDSSVGAPDNIDEALIQGAEAQGAARWGALKMQTSLTWLNPENDAGGANKGNSLPRRREQTARMDLDYDWRRLSVGMSVFGTSNGYDNIANTTPLPGYALLHLRAALQVMPEWQLQVEGRNLLDKEYETAASYKNYGASFMATVRFTPSHL